MHNRLANRESDQTHDGSGRCRSSVGRTVLVSVCLMIAAGLAGCEDHPTPGEAIRVKIEMGGLGDTPGRLAYPRCLEADPTTNTLWLIDKTGRVQQVDAATGECVSMWKMPLGENGKPTGCTLALDDDGRPLLYVADTHYHRVMIYRADERVGRVGRVGRGEHAGRAGAGGAGGILGASPMGSSGPTLVGMFGEYGTGPGQFVFPTDIAVVPKPSGRGVSRIYVSEYGGNDRISVFDGAFNCLFTFGTYGNDASPGHVQFDRPQSMMIVDMPKAKGAAATGTGADRELFIADARNHRIGRFTLEGELIGWFGDFRKPGNGLGEFRIPYGLHDLGDGTALVTEFGNNRVQRIDLMTGAGLGSWGKPGRGEGELFTPWAVTTMGSKSGGLAYVLDSGNNRVIGFAAPRRRNE